MLQCLCGRSLRTSNSLSGEKNVLSLALKHPLSLLLAPSSLPTPLFRAESGGRKAFPYWGEIMAPPRVVFFFFPLFKSLKSSALYRTLTLTQRLNCNLRVSFGRVL